MSKRQMQALVMELLAHRPVVRRKDLALRYGVSERTIDRWKEDGLLPRPKYLQGPFWTPSQIAEMESRETQNKQDHEKRNES